MIGSSIRSLLGLTAGIVVVSVGWSVVRYRTHADDRATWIAVTDQILEQGVKIDSLETLLEVMQDRQAADRGKLAGSAERITHLERQVGAVRRPASVYREYQRTIDDHNETVSRVNRGADSLRAVWDTYSELVDTRNALVDSANVLQRRAVQEGFRLPEVKLE